MKTLFTKKEILKNCGCYSQEKAKQVLTSIKGEPVTIKDIMNLDIPLKDKRWFVWNTCQLSLEEKKELSLKLAWIVLPIYEEKYHNDNRVKSCLQATDDFNNKLITIEVLREKRKTAYVAYVAYAAADAAAYAAAYAAYAAAYAAAAYADADAAAYAAAYADADDAAYAAAAADADAAADAYIFNGTSNKFYSQKIQELFIEYLTT